MKLGAIAFVTLGGAKGNTVLTRGALTSNADIAKNVEALKAQHGEHVYALRSFVDKDGNEVIYEIITPVALAAEPGTQMARVEYWRMLPHVRPLFPKFDDGAEVDKSQYRLAGVLIVPEDDAVRHATDYTDLPDLRWNPAGDSYACTAGDVFVVSSPQGVQAHALESFGRKKVIFQ